ncbi:MAG: PspA/IM30 family protein [Myxococcota bacterium]
MKLFDRLAMLAKADAHGVVESLEDRALLLKQYVREAEIEVDRKRARVEALDAEHHRLSEEGARATERMRAIDADISLAMGEDKEDLARFSIKKLLPLRSTAERIQTRLEQVGTERQSLSDMLQSQQSELDELKHRVRSHLATQAEAAASDNSSESAAYHVTDEDVELELLRRQQGGVA